jgi:hypothetical protein
VAWAAEFVGNPSPSKPFAGPWVYRANPGVPCVSVSAGVKLVRWIKPVLTNNNEERS